MSLILIKNQNDTEEANTERIHALSAVFQEAETHCNLFYRLRYFRNSTEVVNYTFSMLAIAQSYITFETQLLSCLEESILDLKGSISW